MRLGEVPVGTLVQRLTDLNQGMVIEAGNPTLIQPVGQVNQELWLDDCLVRIINLKEVADEHLVLAEQCRTARVYLAATILLRQGNRVILTRHIMDRAREAEFYIQEHSGGSCVIIVKEEDD